MLTSSARVHPAVLAPMPTAASRSDYARVAHAIGWLRAHAREQPSLEELAAELGLSEFHLQRLFQRWAGVSPKRFLQALTLQEARRLLRESRSVLEATYALGLSSPARLHDLFLSLERMTPGEYKAQAEGMTLTWAVEPTPLGEALLVATERGLCGLSFLQPGQEAEALREAQQRWPRARFEHRPRSLQPFSAALQSRLAGAAAEGAPLSVVLKGTALQLKVWEALLRIPEGAVVTYADVARAAGAPRAVRAVASAIGANPLAVLIPCHRVLQATGDLGGYHWGVERKVTLLALEQARRAEPVASVG